MKAIGGSDVCETCAAHVKVITEDLEPRIAALEVALRSVRTILQSDCIEYDDMRHIDHIIDAALAGSSVETPAKPKGPTDCGSDPYPELP
jgi:hypothetical protein